MATGSHESAEKIGPERRDALKDDAAHLEKVNTTWDDVSPIDEELDKRITAKFDRHIIPWLFGLWLLAFIDRSNIGNAKIVGLTEDLHLTSDKFNVALAIFYVPYICYDIPSNLVLKKLKPRYLPVPLRSTESFSDVARRFYLPFLVTMWGLISLCTGFAKKYGGLLAVRFFLGLAEGGLLGGMIIYLAMFYRRHQMLYRIGMFYCAAPLSGAFGGLLATGLAQIHQGGYNQWPWIFFVEGAITVVVGIISMIFLPNSPGEAKFLTGEEREAAINRMKVDAHGSTVQSDVRNETFSWFWVKRALFNWETLILSLNFFAIITPIYSFSLFLPTIIKSLGYTSVKAQLLTVPPNMGGFFAVLLIGYLSDKMKRRGMFMLIGETIALIGYIMQIASNRPLTRYGGTFFVAAGIFPCSPLVMGWLTNNLSPHYVRAAGTGAQIMVANMAAFIATFTYLQQDA